MKINRRELFKRYSTEFVNSNDLEELQNIFDYASGLIIKNQPLADACETEISLKNSNTYLKAYKKQDLYNDVQREQIKKMYVESNKYYKQLLDNYGIDPYISRMADDYDALTSITRFDNGNLTLTEHQENLFLKCYKDAVFYYNNVTRTKSFKGEDVFREFSEVYLIFIAIQKYITERMKDQFNVDTFNKYQCKNYFISNGVDYFDIMPLYYQKRLIKLLNDLQRNKGTDLIFDYIKDVLATNNLNIFKYTLVKTNDNDLKFYKVPYDEEINPNVNEIYTFEEITNDDPYWRASKNEVLNVNFNILETKYISVEYVFNLLKNSYSLSYFTYMLNDLEILNKNNDKKSSLTFLADNISSDRINLYDGLIALYSLFLQYIKNDIYDADNIEIDENENSLIRIYGYCKDYINNQDVNNKLDLIKERINELKNKSENPYYNKLESFIEDFNLSSFKFSNNASFANIKRIYYNNVVSEDNKITTSIKDEFLSLAMFVKAKNLRNFDDKNSLYDLVKDDNIEEALITLTKLFFNNHLNPEFISIYPGLKSLFKDYLTYCIINDKLDFRLEISENGFYNEKFDLFYNYMINSKVIIEELINYVNNQYGYDNAFLNNFLEKMYTVDGPASFVLMFNNLKNFYLNDSINKYRNLKIFLEVFTTFENLLYKYNTTTNNENNSEYSNINISDFNSSFRNNEKMRITLENFIIQCEDRILYQYLKELWETKFVSNYELDLIKEYKYFKDYLAVNNEDLYIYVTNFKSDNYRDELEEKILNLSDKMENYIGNSDKIIYNSTLNVIFSKIKIFAEIMIEVFKAYTLDTIYSGNVLSIDDKFSNHVKIFDEVDFSESNLEFTYPDYLDVTDDIIDDNGDMDYKLLLLVQNVFYTNDENGNLTTTEDDITANIYIFEENDSISEGFKKDDNVIDVNENYLIDSLSQNFLLPDNKRKPTLKLKGNKTGLVELNRNKHYIIGVTYSLRDMFNYVFRINNINIDINNLLIYSTYGINFFAVPIDDVINKFHSNIYNKERFINRAIILYENSNGVINIFLYDGVGEKNGFTEIGNGFDISKFKTFYELLEREPKPINNFSIKKVFHRKYLDETFIDACNNDNNKYNDIYKLEMPFENGLFGIKIPSSEIDFLSIDSLYYFIQDLNEANKIEKNIFHTKYVGKNEINHNTINNNASLLSLTSAILSDTPRITTTTIEFIDMEEENGEYISNFAYIDVENKGITSSNHQPYLEAMTLAANELELINSNSIEETIDLINEVPSNLSDTNLTYYFKNSGINEDQSLKANQIYNSDKKYTIFTNENNESIYNFDDCQNNNTIENVIETGRIKNSLVENKIFGFKVYITDENNNIISFENFNSDGSINNIFNNVDLDITKNYKMTIYSYVNQSALYNGNFIYELVIDTDKTVGFNINEIQNTFITDINENTVLDNAPRYFKKNVYSFTMNNFSENYKLSFKLKGILTFETFVDYNQNTQIIYNPHTELNSIIMWQDTKNIELNLAGTPVLHTFMDLKNKRVKTCTGWENTIRSSWLKSVRDETNKKNYEFNRYICLENEIYNINIKDKIFLDEESNINFKHLKVEKFKYTELIKDNKVIYGDCYINNLDFSDSNYTNSIIYFNAKDIYNVIIPSSIRRINTYSFFNTNITLMIYGPNLYKIEGNAFSNSLLEEIYFLNDKLFFEQYLTIEGNAFFYTRNFKNKHFIVQFPRNINILSSGCFNSSTVNSYDFSKCNYLYSIEDNAFYNNDYLGRRYIIDSSNNEVKENNSCVYEGENSSYISSTQNQPNSGYKFINYSDELYIHFNHGEGNSYLFLGVGCFASCVYLRRAYLGNVHTISTKSFENNIRLNYVECKELRYLGVNRSSNFVSNGITYNILTYTDNNGNKYYADRYNKYIEIDGTQYKITSGKIQIDGNEYTLKYEECNTCQLNSINSSWVGNIWDYGKSFINCYSLLEIKIGDKLKVIQNSIFESSGVYFIFNKEGQQYLGFSTISNNEILNEVSPVSIDSEGLYTIDDFYIPFNSYDINRNISDDHSIINNYNIIKHFKIIYEGTDEQFKNVIKKRNWNSLEKIKKSYNVIGIDENYKAQFLIEESNGEVIKTHNLISKYDSDRLMSYIYNPYSYSVLNNPNVFDLDFIVEKFYTDSNHTIETNEVSFTSFKDILNNNKTNDIFYNSLINAINNFDQIEAKFVNYENDGTDVSKPRNYKPEEKIDRYFKTITFIRGNENTPLDNSKLNKTYYFTLKAINDNYIIGLDNKQYNTRIFIDSEKIKYEPHYHDNTTGYWTTDVESKLIDYKLLQEAINNDKYNKVISTYTTCNFKTEEINETNPKTYQFLTEEMNYQRDIIDATVIEPKAFNPPKVISNLLGENAFIFEEGVFLSHMNSEAGVTYIFSDEVNVNNPDFDPNFVPTEKYQEKMIMFNNSDSKFENSYQYTENYCYIDESYQYANYIVGLEIKNSTHKNNILNSISHINGIVMSDDNSYVKSFNIGLYLKQTKYIYPYYGIDVSENSSNEIIPQSGLSLLDIYNSLKNACEIDLSTRKVKIYWNAGISEFDF